MKRRSALFLLAASTFAREACAVWVRMSDAELVAQSDLIVSATLARIERQGARAIGVLEVHEVLKGGGKPAVVHLALHGGSTLRSSSDIPYSPGQQGLWFLRALPLEGASGPLYRADHPQRFLRDEEAQARLPALRALVKARR